MRKAWLIVNPKSGVGKKGKIVPLAEEILRKHFELKIIFTEYAGHAVEIAADAAREKIDVLIACGGDGTLNECGRSLVNTDVALGIIPAGSGNGLARHLGIPLNHRRALTLIATGKTKRIDTFLFGNHFALSNAGMGFVARVVDTFHNTKRRGFFGYTLHVLGHFFNYHSPHFDLTVDEKKISGRFFMLNICNTNQYGYNARIAPQADVEDGWLDLVLVNPIPKILFPFLLIRLFTGTLAASRNVQMIRCKNLVIENSGDLLMQCDGEKVEEGLPIQVRTIAASLLVIAE